MYDLEGLADYNNLAGLLGIDGMEGNEELLGRLRRMNPIQRQQLVNKLTAPPIPSSGSRAEMEKHFKELPGHITKQLLSKELRLADTMIYGIKPVTSKTIKMFETQDDKQIGLSNISNAKLPKNQVLIVSGIVLLAGVAADATKDKMMSTSYVGLENFPALATGEVDLKSNRKQIFPEMSMTLFKTANNHKGLLGYYKLSNPRLITDDILIELTITLGTMDGIPANTCIYAGLHGTITTP